MRKFLTIALAAAAMAGFAGSSIAGVGQVVKTGPVSMIEKTDWRDCSNWDRRHHMCRDREWDHHRDRGWYGIRSCRMRGHDHFIGEDGRWHECPRRVGY